MLTLEMIEENKTIEQIIWFVVPILMIQGVVGKMIKKVKLWMDEETECVSLLLVNKAGEQKLWSVALVSMIQGVVGKMVEKIDFGWMKKQNAYHYESC